MSVKTVLFDLDGTLLPMDQDAFLKAYFGRLAARLAPLGYEAESLIKTIWAGTADMMKNDGSKTNETAFWDRFASIYGEKARDDEPSLAAFYEEEFDAVQPTCGYTPMADAIIKKLKTKGYRVALATNPIFPAIATEKRIRWAGLDKEDFELVTTYENSRHCKPNPAYFKDVTEALGVSPKECLMIGNDATEDTAAEVLGITVFLLTDNLINKENKDIGRYPHGDFEALARYIDELPDISPCL